MALAVGLGHSHTSLAASLITENSFGHFPSASCAVLSKQLPRGGPPAGYGPFALWLGEVMGSGSIPGGECLRTEHPTSPPAAPPGCKHNPALSACDFFPGAAVPIWIPSLVGARSPSPTSHLRPGKPQRLSPPPSRRGSSCGRRSYFSSPSSAQVAVCLA